MNSSKKNILEKSVQYLKSVGPKRADAFRRIGIKPLKTFFYFPSKHLEEPNILNAARCSVTL